MPSDMKKTTRADGYGKGCGGVPGWLVNQQSQSPSARF